MDFFKLKGRRRDFLRSYKMFDAYGLGFVLGQMEKL
jgi:hypothetical protein